MTRKITARQRFAMALCLEPGDPERAAGISR